MRCPDDADGAGSGRVASGGNDHAERHWPCRTYRHPPAGAFGPDHATASGACGRRAWVNLWRTRDGRWRLPYLPPRWSSILFPTAALGHPVVVPTAGERHGALTLLGRRAAHPHPRRADDLDVRMIGRGVGIYLGSPPACKPMERGVQQRQPGPPTACRHPRRSLGGPHMSSADLDSGGGGREEGGRGSTVLYSK